MFEKIPFKSTIAAIVGLVVPYLLTKGYIDNDTASLILGLNVTFFGAVNMTNALSRRVKNTKQ